MADKNAEILEEVNDEIESALKDARGLIKHQRRLAFVLSLGTVTLLENYFIKLKIFKGGAKINHLWLKKKKENAKKLISNQITSSLEKVGLLDEFLDIAYKIESERDKQAYGKIVSEDVLKKKINLFLELKKKVENA